MKDKIKSTYFYKVVRAILPANINEWILDAYSVIPIIVILSVLIYSTGFRIFPSSDNESVNNEAFTFTFNRPSGGEDRKIQKVKLYCFTGPSKGVTNGNTWCQEVIDSEWRDD